MGAFAGAGWRLAVWALEGGKEVNCTELTWKLSPGVTKN